MQKEIKILALLIILLANISQAQEMTTVSAKFDFILTLPANNDLSQKFDVGAGIIIGAAIFFPEIKTYITPQGGVNFMVERSVGKKDYYRESIFFANLGGEIMYQLVDLDSYKLLPYMAISSKYVIDRYLVSNGNVVISNSGSSSYEYEKAPPLFTALAPALNFGLENRIKNIWFVRLSYELYQPKVTADLNNSYDYYNDNLIFDPVTQRLDLSMFKFSFGVYLW